MEDPFDDPQHPVEQGLDALTEIKDSIATIELLTIEKRDTLKRIEFGIGIVCALIAYAIWIFGTALGVDFMPI